MPNLHTFPSFSLAVALKMSLAIDRAFLIRELAFNSSLGTTIRFSQIIVSLADPPPTHSQAGDTFTLCSAFKLEGDDEKGGR